MGGRRPARQGVEMRDEASLSESVRAGRGECQVVQGPAAPREAQGGCRVKGRDAGRGESTSSQLGGPAVGVPVSRMQPCREKAGGWTDPGGQRWQGQRAGSLEV